MENPSGSGNLGPILKAAAEAPLPDDIEQDPGLIREAVRKAAALLVDCYGAGALDRAKLLEQSAADPMFAKLVTAEVKRHHGAD